MLASTPILTAWLKLGPAFLNTYGDFWLPISAFAKRHLHLLRLGVQVWAAVAVVKCACHIVALTLYQPVPG